MNRTFTNYRTDYKPTLANIKARRPARWTVETIRDIELAYAEFRADIRKNPLMAAIVALLGMALIAMFIAAVLGD